MPPFNWSPCLQVTVSADNTCLSSMKHNGPKVSQTKICTTFQTILEGSVKHFQVLELDLTESFPGRHRGGKSWELRLGQS